MLSVSEYQTYLPLHHITLHASERGCSPIQPTLSRYVYRADNYERRRCSRLVTVDVHGVALTSQLSGTELHNAIA